MKISHRLMAMTAFTSLGLAAVAGLGYFAVTSIQSDLRDLTLQATPLQNRTHELQERTERGMGALLRLSLARNPDDAAKGSAAFDGEMKELDRLVAEIAKRDSKHQTDLGSFRTARGQIADAVGQRLQGDTAYRREAEQARSALALAEQAITATRAAVGSIETEAGRSADKAQDAGRGIASATKAALVAQARLKELAILVGETDQISSRFRVGPLKERLKASVDGLQRMVLDGAQADLLKGTQAVQTLRAMLAQIQQAGTTIQAGSQELVQGNQDLSSRTEQQAGRLQQTVASMRLLTDSVRSNNDAARQVDVLAAGASQAASQGGDAVARVVAAMGTRSRPARSASPTSSV